MFKDNWLPTLLYYLQVVVVIGRYMLFYQIDKICEEMCIIKRIFEMLGNGQVSSRYDVTVFLINI